MSKQSHTCTQHSEGEDEIYSYKTPQRTAWPKVRQVESLRKVTQPVDQQVKTDLIKETFIISKDVSGALML